MLKINEEELKITVKESYSIAEVARKLNLVKTGGLYRRVKFEIQKLNLDISHFTGQRWAAGKTFLTEGRLKYKYSLEEIFCENSNVPRTRVRSFILKNNLIPYSCSICSIKEWNSKSLVLDLEHKNGVRNDNRLENLTFLCPNCHSQTTSFRGRGSIRSKEPVDESVIIEALKNSYSIREALLKFKLSDGLNYNRIKKIIKNNNIKLLQKDKVLIKLGDPNWRTNPKPKQRKVVRPSKEELQELIKKFSMLQIAKNFNLKSGNSILKWCKTYGIDHKILSPFSHKNTPMMKQQAMTDLESVAK